MPTFVRENNRLRRRHSPWRSHLSRTHRKLLLFFLKCVIMVVVMSLFLFFLGFAAVVLVYFLFMSNPFHRRCTRLFHQAGAADDGGVFSAALPPEVAYTAVDFPTASDCAICLDSFREGDHCRNVPICGHLFHAKCVDRWIRKKPTCPICRTRVDLDPGGMSGSRIGGDDQCKRVWTVNFEEGTSY